MNNKLDITALIEKYGLKGPKLAAAMFPKAKHPWAALRRIIHGKSELTQHDVEALADYIGLTVPDLYREQAWSGLADNIYLTLRKGSYEVKFTYGGHLVRVYKDEEPLGTFVMPEGLTPIEDFLEMVEHNIKAYEAKLQLY